MNESSTPEEILASFLEFHKKGDKVALATVIRSAGEDPRAGAKMVVTESGNTSGDLGRFTPEVREMCRRILTGEGKGGVLDLDGAAIYVEAPESGVTLLIAGAGHIGERLARMGTLTGFKVVVVDDREEYADRDRFPEADRVIAEEFSKALESFPIDERTYIVLVTRGHRHDEDCLRGVVSSRAAYVGMIGSRRRVGTVLRHLEEDGYSPDDLSRVYTPVGLDIGSETPGEIAVSILSEIVRVRRGGTGRSLRDLKGAE